MGIDKPAGGPAADPELGEDYFAVVDPFVEHDVAADTDFKASMVYANAKVLWNGEAGSYKGFRFVRSNLIPMLTSAAAATTGDNPSDNGTITANFYVQVMVTGVDTLRGYERVIYQSSSQQVSNDAENQHTISVTMPATTGYTYNIYASVPQSGATSSATSMFLQGTGFSPNAVIKIGSSAGSASASRLVLAEVQLLHLLS